MKNYMAHLGRQMYRLRRRKGLTQKQLADKLGVTQPYIAMLESGRGDREPALSLILSIAELFDTDINALLGIDVRDSTDDLSEPDRDLIEQLSARLARANRSEKFGKLSRSILILGDETVDTVESDTGVKLSPGANDDVGEFHLIQDNLF